MSEVVGVHKITATRVIPASGYSICDKCMDNTTFIPAKPVLVRQIATGGATGLHRVHEPVVCAECGLHLQGKIDAIRTCGGHRKYNLTAFLKKA